MELRHRLNRARLLSRIAVIGCGGTGACLIGGLPFLNQALVAMGHPGLQVVIVDGDKVSAANCVRQPFSQSEIGLYKSVVLANRLNLFWGLKWHASTEYVTRRTQGTVEIVISCVDTRQARQELIHSPLLRECAYWLDIGNNADTGQFILGQPKNRRNRRAKNRLPTPSELFPEITTPVTDSGDELPSCGAVEALARQEPFVNQTLAYHALAMLARLLRHGHLAYCSGFMDLRTGRVAPLSIESLHKRLTTSATAKRKRQSSRQKLPGGNQPAIL